MKVFIKSSFCSDFPNNKYKKPLEFMEKLTILYPSNITHFKSIHYSRFSENSANIDKILWKPTP